MIKDTYFILFYILFKHFVAYNTYDRMAPVRVLKIDNLNFTHSEYIICTGCTKVPRSRERVRVCRINSSSISDPP